MGYYIRVLGTQDPDICIDELRQLLAAKGLVAGFELDPTEASDKWTVLDILNGNGEPLAQLERNPVIEGELGQEEMDEFKEDIQDCEPKSAVKWLTGYFNKIQVIYAFQMLDAAFEEDNFKIIAAIKTGIWNKTKGILQADHEGFSNEDGYHILWQFSDAVSGYQSCAVRNWWGRWEQFVMDLGDLAQRREFKAGKVPANAKRQPIHS